MDNNKHSGDNIIFVGGTPRSGTTLVQNVLDSHPEILGLPEFFLVQDIIEVRNKFKYYIENKAINDICSMEQVDCNINDFIYKHFKPLISKSKCRWLSEKTGHNVLVFEELIDIFSSAKFIHVVRDPRAVIASLLSVNKRAQLQAGVKEVTPMHTKSIRQAINFTKRTQHAGFEAARKTPNRVHTVQYEKLVTNPEEETKKLCQFLEIAWSERMLTPSSFKHLNERTMTAERNLMWYDKKRFNRDPETTSLNKWKAKLTPAQQVRISKVFEKDVNLKRLGYDFSLDHLTFRNRMQGELFSALRETIGDARISLGKLIGTYEYN